MKTSRAEVYPSVPYLPCSDNENLDSEFPREFNEAAEIRTIKPRYITSSSIVNPIVNIMRSIISFHFFL